jgi:hypothetical protein
MKRLPQVASRIVRLLHRKITFAYHLAKGAVSNLFIVNEHLALAECLETGRRIIIPTYSLQCCIMVTLNEVKVMCI